MWRFHRERPDDPQTRDRETQRLSRDEYERPLYGSPQPIESETYHYGSPSHENQGTNYARANWNYVPQPQTAARFRSEQGRWANGQQHDRQPQFAYAPQQQRDRGGAPARNLEELPAHELMTRRVATVHPVTSVERAARLMDECDCGALPVVGDNGVLVGMVTDRDIVTRIVARGREVRHAIVADCMTEHIFACFANESVAECMRQMARHQVRRMPIVDERGRLVGILAQSDLARHASGQAGPDERGAVGQVVGEVSQPMHGFRR